MAVIGQQVTHAEETVTSRPTLASEAVETADIIIPAEQCALVYDVPSARTVRRS